VARALKYDVPGPDRRIEPELVRERGWRAAFDWPEREPLRLVVDLGFGRGEFLARLAAEDPETAFVGVEYSFKRVLKLARRLARSELSNVRLVGCTAERAVGELFGDETVACFWINFPDPWPKKRHHRRRMLQPAFVGELARRLEPGGSVYVATDHAGYAESIDAVLAGEPLLANAYAPERFRREVRGRPATAYELEWRAEHRELHFFEYTRVPRGATG
jgi:tRNA (guanine-N7-)-methyltransferase